MSDEIIMGEPWEGFTKADLQAIVEQLELCKFSCEAGALEHNVAFQELKRIASDKHSIAACLANYCNSHGMTKSIAFVTPDDIGGPIHNGEIIMVTVECGDIDEIIPKGDIPLLVNQMDVYPAAAIRDIARTVKFLIEKG